MHVLFSVGQLIIDSLATRLGITLSADRTGFLGHGNVVIGETMVSLYLFKSKFLMNVSGPSIVAACRKTVQSPTSMIVISDSLSHKIGTLNARLGDNEGDVCPGASIPFGMVKFSTDLTGYAPAGYVADPTQFIRGISPLHDSGTGSSLVPATTEFLVLSPFIPKYTIHNSFLNVSTTITTLNYDSKSVQKTIPAGAAAYVQNVTINGVPAASRCHFDFYDTFRVGGEIVITLTADKDVADECSGSLPASLSTGGFSQAR
ncbi:hypothetical protein H0H93_000522 [Arthromyces matolae]|nr:hypothetical protein H0H93_000522 [Arthromyces matolae]